MKYLIVYLFIKLSSRSPHGERGLKSKLFHTDYGQRVSLSSRRAWIEILSHISKKCSFIRSLSSRRAWIEMSGCGQYLFCTSHGRSPHGERGLKYHIPNYSSIFLSRSPHGERGLKFTIFLYFLSYSRCRSPHGERGLKCFICKRLKVISSVALLTESVD